MEENRINEMETEIMEVETDNVSDSGLEVQENFNNECNYEDFQDDYVEVEEPKCNSKKRLGLGLGLAGAGIFGGVLLYKKVIKKKIMDHYVKEFMKEQEFEIEDDEADCFEEGDIKEVKDFKEVKKEK